MATPLTTISWTFCDGTRLPVLALTARGAVLILAIDSSTSAGSAALVRDCHIESERFFDNGRQHSRRLMVEVDELMGRSQRQPSDVDAVAVTIGPGSYSGLRIGLSAAKGICLASGASLITVSTLEAVAAGLLFCAAPVCVVLEARRDEVYTGLYDTSSGRPRRLEEARVLSVVQLLDELRGFSAVVFVGDACASHRRELESCAGGRLAPAHKGMPRAGSVAWLAAAKHATGDVADLATAEPDYVGQPSYVRAD